MAVKNLVRSNIVSQVPYFITFQFEEDTVKPTIKLVEMWRYYNKVYSCNRIFNKQKSRCCEAI